MVHKGGYVPRFHRLESDPQKRTRDGTFDQGHTERSVLWGTQETTQLPLDVFAEVLNRNVTKV